MGEAHWWTAPPSEVRQGRSCWEAAREGAQPAEVQGGGGGILQRFGRGAGKAGQQSGELLEDGDVTVSERCQRRAR